MWGLYYFEHRLLRTFVFWDLSRFDIRYSLKAEYLLCLFFFKNSWTLCGKNVLYKSLNIWAFFIQTSCKIYEGNFIHEGLFHYIVILIFATRDKAWIITTLWSEKRFLILTSQMFMLLTHRICLNRHHIGAPYLFKCSWSFFYFEEGTIRYSVPSACHYWNSIWDCVLLWSCNSKQRHTLILKGTNHQLSVFLSQYNCE